MRNLPNHRGGPFEKFKRFFIPKIKMYTHVYSINLKGKVSDTKNVVTALIYFCNYPYGTPCIYLSALYLDTYYVIDTSRHSFFGSFITSSDTIPLAVNFSTISLDDFVQKFSTYWWTTTKTANTYHYQNSNGLYFHQFAIQHYIFSSLFNDVE